MNSKLLDRILLVMTIVVVMAVQFAWLRLVYHKVQHNYEHIVNFALPYASFSEVAHFVDNLPPAAKEYYDEDFLPSLYSSTLRYNTTIPADLENAENTFMQVIAEDINTYALRAGEVDLDYVDSVLMSILQPRISNPHYQLRLVEETDWNRNVVRTIDRSERFCPFKDYVTQSSIYADKTCFYELEICLCVPTLHSMLWGTIVPLVLFFFLELLTVYTLVRYRNRKQYLADLTKVFSGSVIHDMRNPLSAALSSSEILLADENLTKDESSRMMLEINRKSVIAVNDLIERVLLAVKNQKGKDLFTAQLDIPLFSFVSSIINDYKTWYPGAHFVIDIPRSIYVSSDAFSLTYVVKNLVENAIKYSRSDAQVTVSARKAEDGYVKLSVQDDGIGISRKEQRKIFRFGYRGTSARMAKGSGLGLPLVNKLSKINHWDIKLESTPGKGSVFSIMLKAANDEENSDS